MLDVTVRDSVGELIVKVPTVASALDCDHPEPESASIVRVPVPSYLIS